MYILECFAPDYSTNQYITVRGKHEGVNQRLSGRYHFEWQCALLHACIIGRRVARIHTLVQKKSDGQLLLESGYAGGSATRQELADQVGGLVTRSRNLLRFQLLNLCLRRLIYLFIRAQVLP